MIHTRFLRFAIVGGVSLVIGTSPASAAGVPESGVDSLVAQSTVEVQAASGSGCSTKSVKAVMSEQYRGLAVAFRDFRASVGPGVASSETRATCDLTLVLHPPKGQTYWISGITSRGSVNLDAGVSATYRHDLSLLGYHPWAGTYRFSGPINQDWERDVFIDWYEAIYVPCGTLPKMKLTVEVSVEGGITDLAKPGGQLSLNPTSGDPGVVVEFLWASCPNPSQIG